MKKKFVITAVMLLVGLWMTAQSIDAIRLDKERPTWVSETPMILVGNWDSFPLFRLRVGNSPAWYKEEYYKEHTEETVRKLADMGVTMVMIHFYKGFGLEAEKEHMEEAKKLTELCHKYGLKVGAYVGGTLAYEHFFLEMPEADEWCAPDFRGKPVVYFSQLFRKRPYIMHPGYKEYIKKVLHIAVEDFGVDLIHFDNSSSQLRREVLYHPLAQKHFKKYLKEKYTADELKDRLGLSDVTYIKAPNFSDERPLMWDPLFQEWTDFRCKQLADYYGEMAEYIRSLNSEVAVECNPHGLRGYNTMWKESLNFPSLLEHMDFFWTEGESSVLLEDGTLISRIRTFKMGRSLGCRVFNVTGGKLEMSESLAYNRQGMGFLGGMSAGYKKSESQQRWIQFLQNNFAHYKDVQNVADVAILHSYSTMAYNSDRPYQSTYLFEQALIQAKIPFDIIFDRHLEDLSKYKVLVLADQEALDESKLNAISEFVHQGGGLVATEHTSLYDEPRLRRKQFGLQSLFKVEAPEFPGWRQTEHLLNLPPMKNEIGNGRVVYLSEVKPSVEKPPSEEMRDEYWKLPVNWWEMIESVKWAAKGDLTIQINAPLTVTMELNKQLSTGNLILHLVNYDTKNPNPVKNIDVSLKLPQGAMVDRIQVLSPEFESSQLSYNIEGGKVNFIIPQLYVYDVVVVKTR